MSGEQPSEFTYRVDSICKELNARLPESNLSKNQTQFDLFFIALHQGPYDKRPINPDDAHSRIFTSLETGSIRVENLAMIFGAPKEARDLLNNRSSILEYQNLKN
ncbi:hypothetical protein A2962_02905 [Candidatus Woesebacteria bacterium RIFCSPLOWO2_01_FULL_39_61]|uniref:Uncharacterized protein n=1 Tax=Candidatus Woesebacteria bacterium RIFCSPHIGHO2_02_FULL_39_13 TaxID=1802505 RepID=A0A1F7Z019_9BACT|nr:MAG: hypothetical protein A2692_00090 [Candidatus Woesebacteria bacterium RIFCSPHIGHO2_01_FULL_39_95]OGM32429.1 MAG: hypothetical protein A3D01_04620 [Candidatus Woesebacteria bacterium RIFCSPHIGHO2_02_FULL_39_13]OGM67388.1 MAG: hypothetical protein A2962_02905 [Candidatus Woesebacteria bacterium RIFCSPLOWO2_01_FULL_39_61]OGM74483.1 MAG: hypothetical protein A3H19_05540 [Candidatus Woesebacteria bacterium RIFCSPLOWO2_12_FULL_39_9]